MVSSYKRSGFAVTLLSMNGTRAPAIPEAASNPPCLRGLPLTFLPARWSLSGCLDARGTGCANGASNLGLSQNELGRGAPIHRSTMGCTGSPGAPEGSLDGKDERASIHRARDVGAGGGD